MYKYAPKYCFSWFSQVDTYHGFTTIQFKPSSSLYCDIIKNPQAIEQYIC